MSIHKLSNIFGAFTGGKSDKKVQSIAMVGAIVEEDNPDSWGYKDMAMLVSSLYALRRIGAEITPDCAVETYNLAPKYGGNDFLEPKANVRADVVVMGFVHKTNTRNLEEKRFMTTIGEAGLMFSDHEMIKSTSWNDAAVNAGAHTVITFGNATYPDARDGEVIGRDFSMSYQTDAKSSDVITSLKTGKDYYCELYQAIQYPRTMQIMSLKR